MKKITSLILILVASFLCTACINNFAIQELNQIGSDYLKNGDVDNAIARFKSSIDLDENIYVSRYNLGVAYITKEEYKNAVEALEKAIEINPNAQDAYYSLGVALENDAFSYETPSDSQEAPIVTEDTVKAGLNKAKRAVSMYEKYLKLAPNANDKDAVLGRITEIKYRISTYCNEFGIDENSIGEDAVGAEEIVTE